MIRSSPLWGKGGLVLTDREGRYRISNAKPKVPKPRRPTSMEACLVKMLETTNYIRPEALDAKRPDRVIQLLRRARMVLYSELRRLWVPDVGTYDWIVSVKQRMVHFRINEQEPCHVDAARPRTPAGRSRQKLPVPTPGDRQPLRFEDARTPRCDLPEGYTSYG